MGCPGAKVFKAEWEKLFKDTVKIYICFDNDIPGIEGAIDLSEKVFKSRNTYNILLPRENGVKDINDLLVKAKYSREDFMILISQATIHKTVQIKNVKEILKEEKKKEVKASSLLKAESSVRLYSTGRHKSINTTAIYTQTAWQFEGRKKLNGFEL